MGVLKVSSYGIGVNSSNAFLFMQIEATCYNSGINQVLIRMCIMWKKTRIRSNKRHLFTLKCFVKYFK